MTEYNLKKIVKNKFGHKMAAFEKLQKMQIQLSCIHIHLQSSINYLSVLKALYLTL